MTFLSFLWLKTTLFTGYARFIYYERKSRLSERIPAHYAKSDPLVPKAVVNHLTRKAHWSPRKVDRRPLRVRNRPLVDDVRAGQHSRADAGFPTRTGRPNRSRTCGGGSTAMPSAPRLSDAIPKPGRHAEHGIQPPRFPEVVGRGMTLITPCPATGPARLPTINKRSEPLPLLSRQSEAPKPGHWTHTTRKRVCMR